MGEVANTVLLPDIALHINDCKGISVLFLHGDEVDIEFLVTALLLEFRIGQARVGLVKDLNCLKTQ